MKQKHHAAGASEPSRTSSWTSRVLALLTTAALVAAIIVTTGCSRARYRVALNPNEGIAVGQEVRYDGRTAGKVTTIINDGGARYAEFEITDRTAQRGWRVGAKRERPGGMLFSSADVAASAPQLQPGAIIPTRSLVDYSATTVLARLDDVLDLARDHPWATAAIALAALAVVAGLLRLAAGRAVLCLALVGLLALAVTQAHGATFRAKEVEAVLDHAESVLSGAQHDQADAARLTAAGLVTNAQEPAVRALFAAMLVGRDEGRATSMLQQLSIFTTEEHRLAMMRRVEALARRHTEIADRMAALGSSGVRAEDNLVALFLRSRERIRNYATREATANIAEVLRRLHRLGEFPAEFVEGEMVHFENVDRVRLADGRLVLPNGTTLLTGRQEAETANVRTALADLQAKIDDLQKSSRPPEAPSTPTAVNDKAAPGETPSVIAVAPTTSQAQPASAAPKPDSVTTAPTPAQSPGVSEHSASDASSAAASPQLLITVMSMPPPAAAPAPTTSSPKPDSPSAAYSRASGMPVPTPKREPGHAVAAHPAAPVLERLTGRVGLAAGAVIGVFVLGGLLFLWLRHNGTVVMVFSRPGSTQIETRELNAQEQAVLLTPSLTVADKYDPQTNSAAKIQVGWRGPVLTIGGSDVVTVGGEPVFGPRRLAHGSEIAIRRADGSQASVLFIGLERPHEAEEQAA